MDFISYDNVMQSMTATKSEMIKLCRWKEQNCLDEKFWAPVLTKIGLCRQLMLSDRKVSFREEKLQIILGLYNNSENK